MGGIGTWMGIMGITQGIGQIASGVMDASAYEAQADFQKSQFEFSSKIADLQGKDAIKRGAKQAKLVRQAGKKIIGTQRAAFAAQGIEIDSGSALDVQTETAAFTEMDALTVKMNAYREAWGYKVQAANYLAQGQYAGIAGQFKSASSILTGGLAGAGSMMQGMYYMNAFGKSPSPIATPSPSGAGWGTSPKSYGPTGYGRGPM